MGTSLLWQTDSQLHDAVQRQLECEPEIDVKAVAITASDGVISLTGFVDSYAQKFSAEQAVKRVRGVRGVANDIHVKVGDERSDLEIARDALQALQRHTNVPRGITVTVREGCITLEGGVEWNYQRSAAESAVRHLKGVKNVSNAISIHPVASPGQAKVLIEDALKRSADVDAGRVRVHAEGSTITLTGSVTSWVAKFEAERAAWSTPGVGKVENHLIVTP
jgi:osmotically-inducible protein OsmY